MTWLKSYAVYLAVALPFLIPVDLLVHQHLVRAVLIGVIVFGGLMVKDPVQRRIWP